MKINTERFIVRKFENETIFLDVESGTSHVLNDVATIMLEYLEEYKKTDIVLDHLFKFFQDANHAIIEKDYNDFICKMIEKGMIILTKEDIYRRIPQTSCSDSCYKCCTNMIQFSRSEEEAMGGYEWNGKCSHLVNGKCSIYENRPFVCRIYGASVLFKCDGCTCDELLGEDETRELVHEYVIMKKSEETI